ncbi:hypothetical protein EJJ20_25970 [Pseudomonas poae]|nr:hypothetical protein EJJ20_25970 [Pseudomonas poae]
MAALAGGRRAEPTTTYRSSAGAGYRRSAAGARVGRGRARGVRRAGRVGAVRRSSGQSPDALAVVDEQGALTYRELERAAEELAARLRLGGVRPMNGSAW